MNLSAHVPGYAKAILAAQTLLRAAQAVDSSERARLTAEATQHAQDAIARLYAGRAQPAQRPLL